MTRAAAAENELRNDSEMRARKPHARSMPTRVYVELTRRCRGRCVLCPRTTGGGEAYTTAPDMPFWLFEKIVEQLFPTAAFADLRAFGESTLYPRWLDVLDVCERLDTPVFGLVTDLQSPDREMWRRLVRREFVLGISVDGLDADTFESVRRQLSFRALLDNLGVLRSAYGNLPSVESRAFLLVTVRPENAHNLAGFVRLASDYAIGRVEFSPLRPDHAFQRVFDVLTEARLARVVESAIREGEKRGVAVGFLGRLARRGDEVERTLAEGDVLPGCPRPWNTVLVATNGSVRPCNNHLGEYVIGSLHSDDFVDIWNGEPIVLLRERIDTADAPSDCLACRNERIFTNPLRLQGEVK